MKTPNLRVRHQSKINAIDERRFKTVLAAIGIVAAIAYWGWLLLGGQ